MSSSQHHTTGRDARRGALLLQLVALLFASLSSGRAETAMPGLVIQREIGETLVRAVLAFDGSGTVQGSVTDRETACAGQHLDKPRLAVVAGAPRPLELEACRQTTGSEVLAMTIGYQAVALVVPADAPAFPLGVTDLFRAVAGHSDQRPFPVVWRDVDPNLPALPIGFLAPPIGSVASRLFDTYVMEPACSRLRGTHAPFELARRMEYCIRLRADPSIVLRNGGSDEIADWAKSAPAGRPAVVSLAELRQLDQIVVALPLDGVLPTADNIESGRYPAAEKIALLIVLPHEIPHAHRKAVRQAAFELLSERSIGPDGSLAQAGLIPLPPVERVALRLRAIAFVEQP